MLDLHLLSCTLHTAHCTLHTFPHTLLQVRMTAGEVAVCEPGAGGQADPGGHGRGCHRRNGGGAEQAARVGQAGQAGQPGQEAPWSRPSCCRTGECLVPSH